LNLPGRGAPPRAPDDDFARLKREIIARTGHFYYQDKDDLLWDRVRRRLDATGASGSATYLARLTDPRLGPAEWMALEAEITIGETFFFRYVEQFAALRDTILPDLLAKRAPDRRLRIWSAGCATGAEPYSLSILLHEMLGEAISDWRISILGSDINETFLEAGRQARFGRWALRSLSAEDKARWFVEDGGDSWTVRTPYRGLVRFERSNLLDLLSPTKPLELADFDLILCRNVLIYFQHDMVVDIVQALGASLQPEGWMLLGHAEPNPAFGAFLAPISLPGTVAYRPLEAGDTSCGAWPSASSSQVPLPQTSRPQNTLSQAALSQAALAPGSVAPAWSPASVREAPLALSAGSPAPPKRRSPAIVPAAETLVDQLRTRANAGDYDGARLILGDALARFPENPVLHFYGALIDQALDHPSKAEDGFRKALYLDPTFVMARYHLGLLRIATGREPDGSRAVAAAAQMAGTLAQDVRLPEGAGLTAGELRELARRHFTPREGA
jgi:chemotaxis protein methyltransferase CheR